MRRRLFSAAGRMVQPATGRRLRFSATAPTGRAASSQQQFDPSKVSAAARARANVARDAFQDWNKASREELHRIMNETLSMRSRRLALALGAGTCTLGGVLWIYRHETKKAVAEELSDVASRSLGDEKMQAQAAMVTIQTLQALLQHGETVDRSVTFLSQVAAHEQTREALIGLLVTALKSPPVLQQALDLTLWVLDDARAREHLVSALIAALKSERFLAAASDFAARWLEDEKVRQTVGSLFKDSSLQVLEDAYVHAEAQKFVKQLLLEPTMQAKTSEHLWAAVKGLVYTPRRRPSQPAVGTTIKAAGATREKAATTPEQQQQAAATAVAGAADATGLGRASENGPSSAEPLVQTQAREQQVLGAEPQGEGPPLAQDPLTWSKNSDGDGRRAVGSPATAAEGPKPTISTKDN